jgi:hypothetical protein
MKRVKLFEQYIAEAKGFRNTKNFIDFLEEIDGMGEYQIKKIMGKDYIDTPGGWDDEKDDYDDIEDYMISNMGRKEFEKLQDWWEANVAESVMNESGEYVGYVEYEKGKKLVDTFKDIKAAKAWNDKNVDDLLDDESVEKVGYMPKSEWDKKEAKYAIGEAYGSANPHAKPAGLSKEETLEVAKKFAAAISKADGTKCTVNTRTLEEDSFDLDCDGEEFDGGSYNIFQNGNVMNMALPNNPVYGRKNDSIDTIVKNIKKMK